MLDELARTPGSAFARSSRIPDSRSSPCSALRWRPARRPRSSASSTACCFGRCRLPSRIASCRLRRRRCCGTISSRSAGRATRSNRSPNTRPARGIFTRRSSVERVTAVVSDRDLFEVLGAPPLAGRTFRMDDQLVAVISEPLWRSRFAGDPNVIGSNVTLDDQSFTVVGVMPEAFQFPYGAASVLRSATAEARVDVWIAEYRPLRGRLSRLVARLKPGATADAGGGGDRGRRDASPLLDTVQRIERARVVPYADAVLGPTRRSLWLLFGAVALVLIAACANVANLLLALTSSRMQEVATRAALGASRARLVRQFMIESLLLALAGGLAGVVVARWTSNLLIAFGSAAHSAHARGRVRLDCVRVSAARVRRDGAVLRHRAGAGRRARRCRNGGEGGRPRNRRPRLRPRSRRAGCRRDRAGVRACERRRARYRRDGAAAERRQRHGDRERA